MKAGQPDQKTVNGNAVTIYGWNHGRLNCLTNFLFLRADRFVLEQSWKSRMVNAFLGCLMLVGCLLLSGCPGEGYRPDQMQMPAELDKNSILRFATDDFFGGAYVDLESLTKNETFQKLPLDLLSYTDIFLDRFDTGVVSEIALFVGENKDVDRKDLGFELAATAKLKSSTGLTSVFEAWQSSANMPTSFEDAGIESIEVAGKTCFRCPTGTFLNSRNAQGVLRWYGPNGKPRVQGINVGSFAPRGYIAGESKSKVIATFDVNEKDIADGKLEIVIEPRVFRTRQLGIGEPQLAIAYLQRPGEANEGETIRGRKVSAEVTSYAQAILPFHTLAGDSNVGDLQQFVRDGKIEVVIESNNEGNYLGLSDDNIALVKDEFEFVCIDGANLVIAQSAARLAEMISAAKADSPSSLAVALTTNDHQQARVFAKLGNAAELKGWNQLLGDLGVLKGDPVLPNVLHQVRGGISMDNSTMATVVFKMNAAKDVRSSQEKVRQWLANRRSIAVDELIEFSRRYEMLATLRRIGLGEHEKLDLTGEGRDRPFQEPVTKSVVEGLFESVATTGDSLDEFTISFAKPECLAGLERRRFHALQLIKLARANECHRLEKYKLHARLLRKTIDQMPEEKALWMRAAHQFSYNVAANAGNELAMYRWVRKGILLSLDGYNSDPRSVDLLCNAAFFIGSKIGASDQRLVHRKLFASDVEIHKRLAAFLDLDSVKTPDGKVDNWLVADRLMGVCKKAIAEGKAQEVSEYRLEVFPATVQFRFAQSMDEEGAFNGRIDRWREAEYRLEALVASRLPDQQQANEGAIDIRTIDVVQNAMFVQQTRDLVVAKLQQLDWVESVHQIALSAYQTEVAGDHNAALEKYQEALDEIVKQVKQFPVELESVQRKSKVTPVRLYAEVFGRMIERYKLALRRLKLEVPDEYVALLR